MNNTLPSERGFSRSRCVDWPLSALQAMPLLGGLSEAALTLLLRCGERQSLACHQRFFAAEATGQDLYLLLEGSAVAAVEDEHCCFVLRRFVAGESFGEAAGIDLRPRYYDVHATAPCRVLRLAASAMARLQALDAEQYTLLMMNLAREFSRRLRAGDHRLVEHWREAQARL